LYATAGTATPDVISQTTCLATSRNPLCRPVGGGFGTAGPRS
jgi:hypothetical protein